MDNFTPPTLGIIELPELSELLRQLGYRIVSGPNFQNAAAAVKAEIDSANARGDANGSRFPVVIADGRKPGIKAWTQKLSATSPVLILRDGDPRSHYIIAEGTRELNLPATVGEILGSINFPVPQDEKLTWLVGVDGSVRPSNAAPSPAPAFPAATTAAPLPEAAPQFPAAAPAFPGTAPSAPGFPGTPAAAERAPWDNRPVADEAFHQPEVDPSMFDRPAQTIFPDAPQAAPVQPAWAVADQAAAPAPAWGVPTAPAAPAAPVAPAQPAVQPDWSANSPAGWPAATASFPEEVPAPQAPAPFEPLAHGRRSQEPDQTFDGWAQPAETAASFPEAPAAPATPAWAAQFEAPAAAQPAAPAWAATPEAAPAPWVPEPAAPAPTFQAPAPVAVPSFTSPIEQQAPAWAAAAEPDWASTPVQPAAPAAPAFQVPVPAAPIYTNPVEPEIFEAAVVNHAGGPVSPIIFDWAYKGGVNKTSLSLQFAHRASECGMKVVLVDMNRGQGGVRTMLRISDDAPIPSAFDAAQTGDPSAAVVLPNDMQRHRANTLAPVQFGVVLAPPRAVASADATPYTAYKKIIDHARRTADLVIVDTQNVEATDNSGLIDKVMVPMMIEDAWGVAITEFGKESVDNLLAALEMYQKRGLARDRQLLTVTRVQGFTPDDANGVERKFGRYARFAGTTTVSSYLKDQLDRGQIISDDPAVRPLLDNVLFQVTGNSVFDESAQKPKKRGLFGGGKR
ncbi:ParA family protein [Leifsonia sp. Leaf264]|uniref:ParA family protein n=1 Tax=Leifsonia sp. Leaf264 TaxID=1736314 RepID=UPI0006FEA10D|nr:hypothetical protein [Leifsonia sp. Leaf264]KQO98868.1 hypothetical protein ASF30_12460 [Leifsonia sp. Leaf264]